MANACNTPPRQASLPTTKVLHFQTGAKHAHEDKLQGTKGLLRNRDMTLGRFLTTQDEVLAFHPHIGKYILLLAKDARN